MMTHLPMLEKQSQRHSADQVHMQNHGVSLVLTWTEDVTNVNYCMVDGGIPAMLQHGYARFVFPTNAVSSVRMQTARPPCLG